MTTDLGPRSSWPVELQAPDIEPHRAGNTGIPFFWSFEGREPGPHAMVTALVHGNELCGALVVDRLLRDRLRPARGRLTLGFCNVAAFLAFDPSYPTLSRFVDEDLNRVWDRPTIEGPRSTVELARARAIRPLLDTVDLLLDIHSMQNPTEPLILAGDCQKGLDLARRVGYPATVVVDAGHAAGARMRDYAFFSDPADPRAALLIECGQHWARASGTVALEATLRFLLASGIVDRSALGVSLGASLGAAPRPQRVVQVTWPVTVRTDAFAFVQPYVGMETIPRAGTVIAHDGGEPVVTPYDDCVLIMPSRRLAVGQTAVRLGRVVDG